MGFLETAAEQLPQIRRELTECTEALGGLSPAEVAFVPEARARVYRPKGLPVAEYEAELTFGRITLTVPLAVWGTFHKAMKGGHEPGERPYEPDSPAHFDVDCVMWGETDVTGELSQDSIEAIAEYVMEDEE